MSSYKIRKSNWLENSIQNGKTLNEIYEYAPERQAKLIAICFNSCLKALERYATENPDFDRSDLENSRIFHPHERKANGAPILLMHSKFFNLKISDADQAKRLIELSQKSLDKTLINLISGGVKDKERAEYKVKHNYNGDASLIDDINRITVVSKNYQLLDMFLNDLNEKTPKEDVCKKDDWDMKPFGLLSRSNDILVDGYPAEIHVNETSQFLLGNYFTHYGYDVVRLNSNDERVDPWFQDLPNKTKKSLVANLDKFDPKYHSILTGLHNDLSELVDANIDSSSQDKQKLINNFNIRSHQVFIAEAEPAWVKKYCEALLRYNNVPSSENLEIDEKLFRFINRDKGLER